MQSFCSTVNDIDVQNNFTEDILHCCSEEYLTNEIVCLGLYSNHFLSHTDTGNIFN